VNKIMEKNSRAVIKMFKFYNIDTANTYPFRPYPESLSCFFANFYKEIIKEERMKAFFLSLVHYHIIPYSYITSARISIIADRILAEKQYHEFMNNIRDIRKMYINEKDN
jgi:hypothetical protein